MATGRIDSDSSRSGKRFVNKGENIVTDALDGLLHASGPGERVRLDGYPRIKVILRGDWKRDRVAVISGGGAGHEPAHAGFVGAGMLTGCDRPDGDRAASKPGSGATSSSGSSTSRSSPWGSGTASGSGAMSPVSCSTTRFCPFANRPGSSTVRRTSATAGEAHCAPHP